MSADVPADQDTKTRERAITLAKLNGVRPPGISAAPEQKEYTAVKFGCADASEEEKSKLRLEGPMEEDHLALIRQLDAAQAMWE
jgi:hypothetical protein